jgi:nitrate reductase assembly molybdenum cofactor insertion protein NarJ
VRIQAAVREHGVPQGAELADHLTVVLPLLEVLPADAARSLADEAVLPALDKVLGAFAEQDNPYRRLLEAARAALMARFQIDQVGPLPQEVHAPSPALFQLAMPPRANQHDDPLPGGAAR